MPCYQLACPLTSLLHLSGKAAIYTVGAGIDPSKILCVALDCGTDNQELLNSELYLGWKHSRLQGEEYDKFVDRFVRAASKQYPNALIHFEDFGVSNALRTLERHKDTGAYPWTGVSLVQKS